MRLDVREVDSYDEEKAKLCWTCYVYLDGVKQPYCVMADEEAGEIERYVVGGQFGETETVNGKVEIRRQEDDTAQ